MNAKIFDIRRFSTHDGDGIRTTVFLKGCPLRCVWCQNPEGIDSRILPIRMENTCIRCGTCAMLSRGGGAEMTADGEICIHRLAADNWDEMISACPSGALMMDARIYSVDEVLREVEKDRVFYGHGGGVTFSGGEPLMQSDFLVEILTMLQQEGIHTAIETSLSVPLQSVQKVAPHLNLIYADLKIADEKNHRKYVGAFYARIRDNLKWLLKSEHKDRVIMRTPLIPGFTATEENLAAVARFLTEQYPEVKYELLNYNPLASAKYHLVDKEFCFKENPKLYTRQQMISFGEIVKNNGIKNLIMEI